MNYEGNYILSKIRVLYIVLAIKICEIFQVFVAQTCQDTFSIFSNELNWTHFEEILIQEKTTYRGSDLVRLGLNEFF